MVVVGVNNNMGAVRCVVREKRSSKKGMTDLVGRTFSLPWSSVFLSVTVGAPPTPNTQQPAAKRQRSAPGRRLLLLVPLV